MIVRPLQAAVFILHLLIERLLLANALTVHSLIYGQRSRPLTLLV